MTDASRSAEPAVTAGDVRLELDGAVATLVLDRVTKRNALTPEMLGALDRHLETITGARGVRVVVVRAAGERAFCVGADVARVGQLEPVEVWRAWTTRGHAVFARLARLRQPSIAVVHATAIGGGLELALAADFRVIAKDALVGLPEVGLGTVPGWGGTGRLVELIGRARAKELVLTRTLIDGTAAFRWGLASRVAAADELQVAVDELVADLLGGAPVAVQLAKQIIDAAGDGASSHVLEALAGGLTAASGELTEGVAAFQARRPPTFEDQ